MNTMFFQMITTLTFHSHILSHFSHFIISSTALYSTLSFLCPFILIYSYCFSSSFFLFLFLFSLLGFLGFEKLTHIPIQKKLIDVSLLTEKEINWLNTYHAEVREKVYPLMITDLGRKWLIESTNPLERK
jgi:C-terminal region of peptidase_M24